MPRGLLLSWLLGLIFCLPWAAVAADGDEPVIVPLVTLPGAVASVDLRQRAVFWIADDADPANPADLSPQPTKAAPAGTLSLRAGEALWGRALLRATGEETAWFLRVASPTVDQVTVFTSRDGIQWRRADAGDQVPMSRQQLRAPMPLFSLPAQFPDDNTAPLHLLVRIRHVGAFSAPVEILDQDTLMRQRYSAALLFGAYFGLAALLASAAAARGVRTRSLALMSFAGFVVFVSVAMAAHLGLAGLYLWPDLPEWNNWSKFVLLGVAGGAFLIALSFSMSLSKLQPRFSRGMLLSGALVSAVSIALPWLEPLGPSDGLTGAFALVSGSAIAAVFVAWRRGDPLARPLSMAVLISFVGALATWAQARGIVLSNPLMWLALPMSLPVAAGFWYRGLIAHAQRLDESRIRETALKMQDPLTGLSNAKALEHKIVRMVGRCTEFRHSAGFIVVKFLNGRDISEEHGRAVIEEALVKVAASLRRVLRTVDMAARMGSYTYVCAIEGPTTDQQLQVLATRIVAAGLGLKSDLPEQVCPDLMVWILRMPDDGTTLGELYGRARARHDARDPTSAKRIYIQPARNHE